MTTTTLSENIANADDATCGPSYSIKEFNKWEDLEQLDPNLLRGIYGYGFDNPSIIQQKSILSLFDRKDMIAQAQSGTGKTGAFTVGVLQNIDTGVKKVQGLILAPMPTMTRASHPRQLSCWPVAPSARSMLSRWATRSSWPRPRAS